jgi:hypothetical protein
MTMMSDKQLLTHYKKCIRSKEKLAVYYENKGNDEAAELLHREIYYMKLKGKKLLEEIKNG